MIKVLKKIFLFRENNDPLQDLKSLLSKIFIRENSSQKNNENFIIYIIGVIFSLILVFWVVSGIYIIQPAEQAVIQRFGKYLTTTNPGMHWYPRFIDKKTIVNIGQVNTVNLSQLMLTEEENIVFISFVVQYRVSDVKDFLFNVQNPRKSLQQILDSAVRQEIGQSKLNEILTIGRANISARIRDTMERLIDRYKLGITIRDVAMQPATAPSEVKVAFDDVIKAREDKARFVNEAKNYANDIIPKARGQASRILNNSQAYQQAVILQAKGKVARFLALNSIYQQFPKITSERMYLSAMNHVFANTKLYLVANNKNNNKLFYIPLPKE